MKTLQFENKDTMPAIGLGTWKATGDEVKFAVNEAIRAGMRHIDTAMIYGNEVEIGQVLAELFEEGVVDRKDIFITSKLWNDAHKPEWVLPALRESLRKLHLDYLDLYLIHWPVATKPGVVLPGDASDYLSLEEVPIIDTWREMEKAKKSGLARHIGVSNFSKKKLHDLVSKASIKPEMNQVEMHPLLQQQDLVDYCKQEDIKITAYSPLGSGDRVPDMKADDEPNLMQIEEIASIARKHNASSAQVLINWHLHRDIAVIPKSTSRDHIIANYQAAEIKLDEEDLETIATLDQNYRFIDGTFFDQPEKGYVNIFDE